MKDFTDVFRKRLRVCMAEADMKPEQLAEEALVSVDGIRKYLRGESSPQLETACKLAEALGCTPNDLCGWEEQR